MMNVERNLHSDAMAEMAELGCPGHGPLLKAVYDAFMHVTDSPLVVTARSEISLEFTGLTGDVSGLSVHMCHGLKCHEPTLQVSWRETTISKSECMRIARGLGDAVPHRDDEPPITPPQSGDPFDVELEDFSKGVSTLRCGIDSWVAAVRQLRAPGAVWYMGANFGIRPNPEATDRIMAHCCNSPNCDEVPLSVRRYPPISGTSVPQCDNRQEPVFWSWE